MDSADKSRLTEHNTTIGTRPRDDNQAPLRKGYISRQMRDELSPSIIELLEPDDEEKETFDYLDVEPEKVTIDQELESKEKENYEKTLRQLRLCERKGINGETMLLFLE